MKASIITIGDEILIGQIIDTNSAWLGQQLTHLGFDVDKILTIADTVTSITETLDIVLQKSDLVILTGGLGPTKDDVTKIALNSYFDSSTYFNQQLFDKVSSYFKLRGIPVTEQHKQQFFMPEKATILDNNVGTAPGMLFQHNGKIILSMPGVPHEMKWIFSNSFLPKIDNYLKSEIKIYQETIRTIGIGETQIVTLITDILDRMPDDISIAYLPSTGSVRLRLMSKSLKDNSGLIKQFVKEISDILGNKVYGYGTVLIEQVVRDLFVEKGLTLSTAESCSAGYLSHRITSIPGASQFYLGSFVTYDNAFKKKFLNVSQETLSSVGAVSEETVIEMLEGLLEKTMTDIGVSISGIAGPSGGSPEKPVGTIWMAYGSKDDIRTKKLQLGKDRMRNIEYTAVAALNALRLFVNEKA